MARKAAMKEMKAAAAKLDGDLARRVATSLPPVATVSKIPMDIAVELGRLTMPMMLWKQASPIAIIIPIRKNALPMAHGLSVEVGTRKPMPITARLADRIPDSLRC